MTRVKLLIPLLLMVTINVFPDENEPGSRVLVRSTEARPDAGSTWVLTLLINHSEPNEVNVLAPHFTGPLLLDQVVKNRRYINSGTGQLVVNTPDPEQPAEIERWTAIDYRFILNSPGIISFGVFTVITPQGRTETAPFNLVVQRTNPAANVQHYPLAWEGIPAKLVIGEQAAFDLRVRGRDMASQALPPADMFMPAVPAGHILESLPLSKPEQSAGIVLKLRLIPLEESPFTLEKRQVSHNNVVFEVPDLRIPVSRAVKHTAVEDTLNRPDEGDRMKSGYPSVPPFPVFSTGATGLSPQDMEQCETIYRTAQNLWNKGRYADTLALLRKNERDHRIQTFFVIIRRDAEQSLGLTGTNDEKRTRFLKRHQSAVLKETIIRRIPDKAGEAITRLREGQPVVLAPGSAVKNTGTAEIKRNEIWIRVITNDGNSISGWVLPENIIVY